MLLVHESGVILDSSPSRLDLDAIERWLAAESYWALGRPRSAIEKSVANSLVYGLYLPAPEASAECSTPAATGQIGFFRVVTDKTTFAWLCDVFVDAAYRGGGLAQWALAHIRDEILAMGVYRILLATADAHAIYEKLGFKPHAEPGKWMELTTRRIGEP